MERTSVHYIVCISIALFINWLFLTPVHTSGYLDLPYSTNKSIVCELLNGTCVARADCAAYTTYLTAHYTPFRFACNKTSVCCYELKLRNVHHASHHTNVIYGHGHHGGHHGGQRGGSLLQTLIKHTNRTGLCEAVGGLCVSPHDCAVSQHGYSKGKFDCNVTSLCCYRYKRHIDHGDYGAGGFHGGRHQKHDVDLYDDIFEEQSFDDIIGLGGYGRRQTARRGYGFRRRRRHRGHVIGQGHGGFGAHLVRPISSHATHSYSYQKPVILLNTNFTELCINAGGTCLAFESCATTGGWHSYSSRKFSCDISNICCFPIPTDRYNFGYIKRKKKK